MQIDNVAVLYIVYKKSKLRYAYISNPFKADSRVNTGTVPYRSVDRTTRNRTSTYTADAELEQQPRHGTGPLITEIGYGEREG